LTNTVREFLSKSKADDTLNFAAQLMWEHDCGVAPVVKENGRLCGVITDRDICMAAYTQGAARGPARR
jgi:CBS domain-containing protein